MEYLRNLRLNLEAILNRKILKNYDILKNFKKELLSRP